MSTADRRKAFLAAAAECFSDLGYDTTTVAQIAWRAQSTVPTLYKYFASKAEMLNALVSLRIVSIWEQISAIIRETTPGLEQALSIVRTGTLGLLGDPVLRGVMGNPMSGAELRDVREAQARIEKMIISACVDLMGRADHGAPLQVRDAEAFVTVYLSAVSGWCLRGKEFCPVSDERFCEGMVENLRAAMIGSGYRLESGAA